MLNPYCQFSEIWKKGRKRFTRINKREIWDMETGFAVHAAVIS